MTETKETNAIQVDLDQHVEIIKLNEKESKVIEMLETKRVFAPSDDKKAESKKPKLTKYVVVPYSKYCKMQKVYDKKMEAKKKRQEEMDNVIKPYKIRYMELKREETILDLESGIAQDRFHETEQECEDFTSDYLADLEDADLKRCQPEIEKLEKDIDKQEQEFLVKARNQVTIKDHSYTYKDIKFEDKDSAVLYIVENAKNFNFD